jgi:glucose-6-phosphate 1-dehydrogenase
MVEETWRVVQPVLDAWRDGDVAFPNYASGSDGPAEADELLRRNGREWRPVGEASKP